MHGSDPWAGLVFSRPAAERKRSWLGSTGGAALAHVGLVAAAVWLTLPGADASQEAEWEQVTYIQLEPEPAAVELPQVEAPAARPPAPPPAPAPAAEPPSATPQGYQTLAAPDLSATEIPPAGSEEVDEADFSGEGVEGGRASGEPVAEAPPAPVGPPALEDAPRMVPMTEPPRLRNQRVIAHILEENYPRRLQQQRVGGTVVLWLFLDTDGRVLKAQVRTSSGEPELDEAALRVAERMSFTPARLDRQAIRAWIVVPLVFQPR